ncbi:hypothetical protein CVT26_006873 [Gymnopilus dilepis]|uniref:factor independent urate hydroxylase n=1 Tax=Gymnopilus dilepis TaxID=231916 RepID=A0A409W0R2_9AGAR|nr:hypothetical protein CVT26_006873 [Gymnopilus dilepis]
MEQTSEMKASRLKKFTIVLTLTVFMVINVANSTSVSVALPTIQKELQLQPAQLQWVVSAYSLSSGCLYLAFGRVADSYGRKKVFCFGSFTLAVFTLACAFANDGVILDILRALQGIGGAATIPASLGILANSFPPSRSRSFAFATFSAGAPIGAVFGTAVGGLLTEFSQRTWRSSFYLFGGLTFMTCLGGLISIDNDSPSEEQDKRIDWAGAFVVTAGLTLIIFVLSQGDVARKQWSTSYIIVLLLVGIALVALFVAWQYILEKNLDEPESRRSSWLPPPLMRPSIWTRAKGRFAAMMIIAFATWCAFLSWIYWIQLFYQNYLGLSAIHTVVRILPLFVSGVLCNMFVGFMAARVPVVWLVGCGAAATTIGCLLFAIVDPKKPYWAYEFNATYIAIMGADFVFSSGTLFIAKFALPHEQSMAAALFNTMTQLGTAVGVTVSTVVYNSVSKRLATDQDGLKAYHAAQWTAFAFGVIATVLGVSFFYGVGVVGFRAQDTSSSTADEESQRHRLLSYSSTTTMSASTFSELTAARYGKTKVRVLRVVRQGAWHHVVEYNVEALVEGEIATSFTEADNSVVVATDSSENFGPQLEFALMSLLLKSRISHIVRLISHDLGSPLNAAFLSDLAKISPHILNPEKFALHLGTFLVSKYAHLSKAFITVEQLRWSRIEVPGLSTSGRHPHSFYRDGDDKRFTKVEVDATAGKDKLVGKVTSGISDLLVLKSTGSAFENFYRDEFTTLVEVNDRIFSTSVDLSYTFAPIQIKAPTDEKKFEFVIPLQIGEEGYAGSIWDEDVPVRARLATLETFAVDESASVQATLFKMAQRVIAENASVQTVTYALPNKHYVPVDMRYIGVDNLTPSKADVFIPLSAPSGLITATVTRK